MLFYVQLNHQNLKVGFIQRPFQRHIQVVQIEIVEHAQLVYLGKDSHKFFEGKVPEVSKLLVEF